MHRSYVGDKQILVDTQRIGSRPAIRVMDLLAGRVNMADLVKEANRNHALLKLKMIEDVLHAAITEFASPFYATGTGIINATLDDQLDYFETLGPVTILGDRRAVSQLSLTLDPTLPGYSDGMKNEYNESGYLGRYKGTPVVKLANAVQSGTTEPILNKDWLYLVPGGLSADTKNLKCVTEGNVQTMTSQNIDDLVFEMLIWEKFGAAFVSTDIPNIGAYQIG